MKIANFKRIDPPAGYLIAKFDAEIGPVTIRNISVFEKDGRRWISEPVEKWTDRDGNTRYHKPAIVTDQETMGELSRMVKAHLPVTGQEYGDDIPY